MGKLKLYKLNKNISRSYKKNIYTRKPCALPTDAAGPNPSWAHLQRPWGTGGGCLAPFSFVHIRGIIKDYFECTPFFPKYFRGWHS